jgi:uncharacterized protein YjiS (DUF1127 family)
MVTMNLGRAAIHPSIVLRWTKLKQIVAEWRRRTHSRSELAKLDDIGLRDVGISRSTAQFEASKPFWTK